MARPRIVHKIDLTAHDRTQPVSLPARGPLELRYRERDGREILTTWISRGLAETYLRLAGYTTSPTTQGAAQ